ncbi:MAG: cytochrome P450-like protein [Polaromonas sp.]|nr:cytochrome P450-like protein [Polaromonas sp.]
MAGCLQRDSPGIRRRGHQGSRQVLPHGPLRQLQPITHHTMQLSNEFPPFRHTPRLPGWDQSLGLLADPYRFISRHCRLLGSDVVQARLMLRPTFCLTGVRAAQLFYDPEKFTRVGAAPEPLRATLFGKGSVHGLDGAAHLHRKRFFTAAMAPEYLKDLLAIAEQSWQPMALQWQASPRTELYGASQQWLMRSVCNWAGVPLPQDQLTRRTSQLVTLFDSAASDVRGHLNARVARLQAEFWLARLIMDNRRGLDTLRERSLSWAAARLTDNEERLLPARIAAVELLNILRPTVAVSVFIVAAAHALHQHPQWAARLRGGSVQDRLAFVQEVRRFYPFIPAIPARVRHDFSWEGHRFDAGAHVLLDVYGINHDPRLWSEPEAFRPERFIGSTPGSFDFIPQGGGDSHTHHRCPGEDVTTSLMALAVRLLLEQSHYTVPPQRLDIQMNRLPALPADRFLMSDFKPA